VGVVQSPYGSIAERDINERFDTRMNQRIGTRCVPEDQPENDCFELKSDSVDRGAHRDLGSERPIFP
jgi:hypothetical protein